MYKPVIHGSHAWGIGNPGYIQTMLDRKGSADISLTEIRIMTNEKRRDGQTATVAQ
jgi:hypothetical protein